MGTREWRCAINYPDIYFTSEYQELFRDTAFGGEPCHFYFTGIDYRFYKRPIEGTPYFDIVSPYGYSGPVRVEFPCDIKEYLKCFHHYCMENNIITEFARLHPFDESHRWLDADWDIFLSTGLTEFFPNCKYEHDIFYVDLTQSEDEIWKGFDKGCKSAIKRRVLMYAPPFRPLYESVMEGVGATPAYLFTERFWTLLPQFGKEFSIFGASCILLKYGDYCHYFLSSTDIGGNTNAMLWEAIKWAKAQGCKIFNLGGGLKAGDSLESFKRSFTKTSKPFYTYRKVHNQEVYNQLCQAKGVQPNSEGYFPAFRSV